MHKGDAATNTGRRCTVHAGALVPSCVELLLVKPGEKQRKGGKEDAARKEAKEQGKGEQEDAARKEC
eukprot:1158448-Pelagomonas_calceolata.AAC.2